jgi:hypothetical protein
LGCLHSNRVEVAAFLIFAVITSTFNYFSIASFSLFLSYLHQAWAIFAADTADKG